MSGPTGARRLHALVVGIDHYQACERPGAPEIPHLGGCVHDARRVAAFLRDRLGVPPERLEVLLSPNPQAPSPMPEATGPLPTLAELHAAFERLGERAVPGDAVRIHFSGHGMRVRTAFPQWKGDGRDEALVPCDAAVGWGSAEEGRRLRVLRDLELAALLRRLAEGGLEVELVLDCCYSGGAVRAPGVRTPVELGADLAAGGPRLPAAELAAAWAQRSSADRPYRAFTAGSGWLPPRGVVLLAACAADEYAWERSFPDGKSGVLTHCLLDELSRPAPERTWRRLGDRLAARVHGLSRAQTPQIEGDVDRLVAGSGRLATPWAVRVLEAGAQGALLLDAGRVHGVGPGSLFAVPTAGGEAVAEVASAEAVTSRAVLRPAVGPSSAGVIPGEPAGPGAPAGPGSESTALDPPVPGALARPLAPAPHLRRSVAPAPDVPRAVAARVAAAAAELDSRFLSWQGEPDSGAAPDFRWGLGADGCFEVRDALGAVLRLDPPLPAEAPRAARRLVARLDHLARYRNVEELENHDPRSPLAGSLELELALLPPGYRPGDPLASEPLPPGPGVATVAAGRWSCLRIHNRSARRLHVALLDLTPTWAVRQVAAGPEIGGAELVDPGGTLAVPVCGAVPPGLGESRDVLKALAATRATSFRWLELPSLDGARRTLPQPPEDALERLFAAVAGAAAVPCRDLTAAPAPGHDWTTAQLVVRVVT